MQNNTKKQKQTSLAAESGDDLQWFTFHTVGLTTPFTEPESTFEVSWVFCEKKHLSFSRLVFVGICFLKLLEFKQWKSFVKINNFKAKMP